MPQSPETLDHLRRARDLMDRDYALPLDVPAMATKAMMSTAHFSKEFAAAYGETPYGYLVTRRVERAMALLRDGSDVPEACLAVGFSSPRSFSSMFTRLAGETPSSYRERPHDESEELPSCITAVLARPTPFCTR
ncbi:MAG: AraC family transcriptional regulator [Gordonia sp. (in: high G+C Gram-positive bacteria)]|uniref:helix-turn-helix domain-containing protein n=1 Tax=Gordonia sp. (in: high G+C Gram-positive bacteria) TaxID=84139 RepID=UPI0039E634CD